MEFKVKRAFCLPADLHYEGLVGIHAFFCACHVGAQMKEAMWLPREALKSPSSLDDQTFMSPWQNLEG